MGERDKSIDDLLGSIDEYLDAFEDDETPKPSVLLQGLRDDDTGLGSYSSGYEVSEPKRVPKRSNRFQPQNQSLAPPGYERDIRGRWRYSATGEMVPGARDLTILDLTSGPWCLCRNHRLIPYSVASRDDVASLLDTQSVWVGGCSNPKPAPGPGRTNIRQWVPLDPAVFEELAQEPLGIVAGELIVTEMLDTFGVALKAGGIAPRTVSAYLARGQMPEPQGRIANGPVWSVPVIEFWLASRQNGIQK